MVLKLLVDLDAELGAGEGGETGRGSPEEARRDRRVVDVPEREADPGEHSRVERHVVDDFDRAALAECLRERLERGDEGIDDRDRAVGDDLDGADPSTVREHPVGLDVDPHARGTTERAREILDLGARGQRAQELGGGLPAGNSALAQFGGTALSLAPRRTLTAPAYVSTGY